MAATATQIITNAFGKIGVFQPEDAIPAEDISTGLTRLNRFLNGLNARGALFPSVTLVLTDNVPVDDAYLDDLEWSLGKAMVSQWGKVLQGQDLVEARQAEQRFIAAHVKVYPATPDAGLRNMPSQRR